MDEEELKSLLESLRQGAARITRERLPWIPSYPWKTRDTAGLVASSPGESIELEAEVDWVRRSMLLYIAVTNPTIPVKALIFSVSVDPAAAKIASTYSIEVVPAIESAHFKLPSPRNNTIALPSRGKSDPLAQSPSPRNFPRSASSPTVSSNLPASPSPLGATPPINASPSPPTSRIAAPQKQWTDVLLAVGFDADTTEQLAQSIIQHGIASPQANVEFDALKQVPGIKLGQVRRIVKHLGGTIPVL